MQGWLDENLMWKNKTAPSNRGVLPLWRAEKVRQLGGGSPIPISMEEKGYLKRKG
jgi:hypothetical protein